MIHRRLLNDDHKFLDENLNEIYEETGKGINVTTKHYVILEDNVNSE